MSLSFDQYSSQLKDNNVISNYLILDNMDNIDPASIYAELHKSSADAFMFESVEGSEKIARYTFIGYKPLELIKTGSYDDLALKIQALSSSSLLPFFHKGYVGFFSFESVADIEPKLKCAKDSSSHMYMQLVGTLLVFDRVASKIYLVANARANKDQLESLYQLSKHELEELQEHLTKAAALESIKADLNLSLDQLLKSPKAVEFKSNTGKERFYNMVAKAKNHIIEGDAFQIVLSHKLSAEVSIDPLFAYRVLRKVNPSPYLFIYNVRDFNNRNFTLVGSSPEMLVKSQRNSAGDYVAEIRPIAGTYPRGKNEAEDELNAKTLLADEKERAEHVMLIDLARNDLGRVAEPGSVTVAQHMIIEKYSHVMHIVSSVIAKLKSKAGANARLGIDLLKACFPAGTLSGAPKLEAIDIIAELECEPRRSYGGAIGYFSLDGVVDSAIMIRTLVVEVNRVEVQAGAGIVADSVPENEYQETYNKAGALIKVVNLCCLQN